MFEAETARLGEWFAACASSRGALEPSAGVVGDPRIEAVVRMGERGAW